MIDKITKINPIAKTLSDPKNRPQVVPNKKLELLEEEFDKEMEDYILDISEEATRYIDEDSWNGF